ncbi:dihydrofolate reductase family protein [Streptosporangium sp. NBC_01495]|uniref:dihydrofolate reductase family protein n=1 Tax=Streptosporangium sp. NBC_01495 TaxID=2903899 RepID=UPI002E336AA1|nr:dihydrofolate reductase family protein [Streptosporangium sp. NBC_01495]
MGCPVDRDRPAVGGGAGEEVVEVEAGGTLVVPPHTVHAFALTTGCDALLLDRVTYEGMAQAWPNMGGNPYSDHVNAMAKYVVASQPVDTAAWNPTVVVPGDDLTAEITKLKEQDGGDILIWGNGRLTDHLATAGLLDEYRIWIYPVLKGQGEPLFRPESVTGMKLADTTTFTSGVTVLAYQPTSD